MAPENKTPVPIWRLLQDLVDADSECLVLIASLDEILVNPELCCCDGLSLWNTGKVKAEFPSVLLVEKILILNDYCGKKERKMYVQQT